jgi:hypothetical protein
LQSAFRQHGSYSTAIVTGPSLDNTHIVLRGRPRLAEGSRTRMANRCRTPRSIFCVTSL